jgi:hypothetical protein
MQRRSCDGSECRLEGLICDKVVRTTDASISIRVDRVTIAVYDSQSRKRCLALPVLYIFGKVIIITGPPSLVRTTVAASLAAHSVEEAVPTILAK